MTPTERPQERALAELIVRWRNYRHPTLHDYGVETRETCNAIERGMKQCADELEAVLVREAAAPVLPPQLKDFTFHFHGDKCYVIGPGDTELRICGLLRESQHGW